MDVRQGTYRVTWTMNVAASFASNVNCSLVRDHLYAEVGARTGGNASCNNATCERPDRSFLWASRPDIYCSAIIVVTGNTTTQALDGAFYRALQESGVSGISVNRLVEYTPDDGSHGYPNGHLGNVTLGLLAQDINSVWRTIVTVPSGAAPLDATPNGIIDEALTDRIGDSSNTARVGQPTPSVIADASNALSRAATSITGSVFSPTTIAIGAVIGVAGAAVLAAYVIRSVK